MGASPGVFLQKFADLTQKLFPLLPLQRKRCMSSLVLQHPSLTVLRRIAFHQGHGLRKVGIRQTDDVQRGHPTQR
eukprot:Skav209697  [mRNA]  locus=scaffold36:86945:90360:- [translate_table: standard]